MNQDCWNKIQKILPLVERPARYIGGELGQIVKPKDEGILRFALCFPEVYEIGVSHYGSRLLYSIVNSEKNLACERAYLPWKDMAELLRRQKIPLVSLETKTPIREFDVVGFSLEYELSFTNVFEMLDLAGITYFSENRDESFPLLIAGGSSVFNPEPVAEIFDLFVIGDSEEMLPRLLDFIRQNKLPRNELLRELSKWRGIYVPRFYRPIFENGVQSGFEYDSGMQFPIKSIQLEDLPLAGSYQPPFVPWIEVVHDRLTVEIMRGCGRSCRFCSAGWIYRPVREKSVDEIMKEIRSFEGATGWEEIGFLSLSATDYLALETLMSRAGAFAESKHVNITLPSVRPENIADSSLSVLGKVRKTTFTFAPESATERLRNVINKPLDENTLRETIRNIYRAGWKNVKLYFMIGLPTETDEDVRKIRELCDEIVGIARSERGELHVSVSPFVPKPHTPFAWEPMDDLENLFRKKNIIDDRSRRKRFKLSVRDPHVSYLETILSRGDRRLVRVIEKAWRNGGGLDAWRESFDYEVWGLAFEECGLDPKTYLGEQPTDGILPWEIIDKGVPKKFLLEERRKAMRAEPSPNCFDRQGCESCGICEFDRAIRFPPTTTMDFKNNDGAYGRRLKKTEKPITVGNGTIRIRFEKGIAVRWISHLDLLRMISRVVRRSGLDVAYSVGHHKHQRVAFGPPLPTGYASRAEFLDIEFNGLPPTNAVERLAKSMPDGIRILAHQPVIRGHTSLFDVINCAIYFVELPLALAPDLDKKLDELIRSGSVFFERHRKTVDISKYYRKHAIARNRESWLLRFLLQCDPNGSGRPEEYLISCGIPAEEALALVYIREELLIERGLEFFDPFGGSWGKWSEHFDKE